MVTQRLMKAGLQHLHACIQAKSTGNSLIIKHGVNNQKILSMYQIVSMARSYKS